MVVPDVCACNTFVGMSELFHIDQLDEDDPFEIDDQAAHLFKHPALGVRRRL